MTKESIKKLIAQDHLAEAIEQLMALVNAYLLTEKDADVLKIQHALIVNSGKFNQWEKDSRLGILERREEQTTIAQIRTAIIYEIEELPDKFWPTSPKIGQNADLLEVKKSSLLLNFLQTHGENATTAQFFQLHNAIEKEFGTISELALDDLIAALAESEGKRDGVINDLIPQNIKTFVANHKGKWSRRDELCFLDELGKRYEEALDKPALSLMLEKSREHFLKVFQDFVLIKGGVFTMGAPLNTLNSNGPQHLVQVSDFYLSKYPVTIAQFETFIMASGYETDADREGGSIFWTGSEWGQKAGINWTCDARGNTQQDKQHPVTHVSWNDAKAYCVWLTKKISMPVRLPREAEWEYACRAATNTLFNTGNRLTIYEANHSGSANRTSIPPKFLKFTTPVGTYPANAWGLYDMHGNVYEWCEDWYSPTWYEECKKVGIVIDPTGPLTGSRSVLRGGSWSNDVTECSSNYRMNGQRELRNASAGFRPAISL